MNTERLAVWLLGLLLWSCSNPEDGPMPLPVDEGVTTQYSIIISKDGEWKHSGLEANAISLHTISESHMFLPLATPDLSYRDTNSLSFLRRLPDCGAEVHYWDPETGSRAWEDVFGNAPSCERQYLAIAHSRDSMSVAYSMPDAGMKGALYYVRTWSLAGGNTSYQDTSLEKEPQQLVWAANRLFVLAYDPATGKNSLLALPGHNGEPETELDLGQEVLKVLKTSSGQLLVSYRTRHLVLDAHSLDAVSRVSYTAGKEPYFGDSDNDYFAPSGLLYYAMPSPAGGTAIAHIPGVYDFSKYTAYLYYYENFLSAERIAQYGIGDTRSVAFDPHNGLLLIGYQKSGADGKGGLLRIKPVPDPEFIDQTDLDGIPEYLIVQ